MKFRFLCTAVRSIKHGLLPASSRLSPSAFYKVWKTHCEDHVCLPWARGGTTAASTLYLYSHHSQGHKQFEMRKATHYKAEPRCQLSVRSNSKQQHSPACNQQTFMPCPAAVQFKGANYQHIMIVHRCGKRCISQGSVGTLKSRASLELMANTLQSHSLTDNTLGSHATRVAPYILFLFPLLCKLIIDTQPQQATGRLRCSVHQSSWLATWQSP